MMDVVRLKDTQRVDYSKMVLEMALVMVLMKLMDTWKAWKMLKVMLFHLLLQSAFVLSVPLFDNDNYFHFHYFLH